MKKGTKSYNIFRYLKANNFDVAKVWHGGLSSKANTTRGFYAMMKNKKVFLGYNLTTIKTKDYQGLFNQYKLKQ